MTLRIGRRGAMALGGAATLARGAYAEGGNRFVAANNSGYDTLRANCQGSGRSSPYG